MLSRLDRTGGIRRFRCSVHTDVYRQNNMAKMNVIYFVETVKMLRTILSVERVLNVEMSRRLSRIVRKTFKIYIYTNSQWYTIGNEFQVVQSSPASVQKVAHSVTL